MCIEIWFMIIGHGNRDHTTSSNRGRSSERLIQNLSKSALDHLCSKVFQAPSFGGGFVIPITVLYTWIFNVFQVISIFSLNLCQLSIGLGLGYSAISIPQIKKENEMSFSTSIEGTYGKLKRANFLCILRTITSKEICFEYNDVSINFRIGRNLVSG